MRAISGLEWVAPSMAAIGAWAQNFVGEFFSRLRNGAGQPGQGWPGGGGRLVSVFEEAPELLPHLSPPAATEAARVRVPLLVLEPRRWLPPRQPRGGDCHLGLLVLDGLLLRRVRLGRRSGTELLGGGDLLQPWVLQPPYETPPVEPGWEVLQRARLAVLDGRFAARVARWPGVAAALAERAIERTRTLAFQLAAAHIIGLERRLLTLMWALADRFGRVTADGVLVPLGLTHATRAELVGASRPSVSTALAELGREDALERLAGGWLLRTHPSQGALPSLDEEGRACVPRPRARSSIISVS
jgi:CRP/FNR family cyclic AMP-dependent transcriptional regulator